MVDSKRTGDRMQGIKAQPHASLNFIGRTHSISVHQFSMRNNGIRGILGAVPVVFTGRFYSKLVPGPTILHIPYTGLLREDECSSKYPLDSSLRATNNVHHLRIYKVYIKA